jgi:hypothetical protein
MAQKPAFGALRRTKPELDGVTEAVEAPRAPPPKPAPETRIQTSVRLTPPMWVALNHLAKQLRLTTGQRVTLHDLLLNGAEHMLRLHGVKVPK